MERIIIAERNSDIVYGSVIQRCLIPKNLGFVLNVAKVPINEIDRSYLKSDQPDNFLHLVSRIMGTPKESIIDERQYQKLTKMFFSGDFWYEYFGPYSYHFFYNDIIRDFAQKRHIEFPEKDTLLLANHSLSLMVSPSRTEFPLITSNFFYNDESVEHHELNLERETIELGAKCFINALSPNKRVLQFIQAAWDYEIPSGQSPKIESDSLRKLFETCEKVCLIPLETGSITAAALLTQGSYVAALLCVGTGAVATLVLIGTVSLVGYIAQYSRYNI